MFDSCLRLSPNRRLPRLVLCVANLRPACIYVQRSRVLFIWPLLGCETSLPPRLLERCIEERQRRVFTSLRSHNSDRQTGKPFFLSLSLPLRFLRLLHSSTFLAISVKYFKDRLPPGLLPRARRLQFRDEYAERTSRLGRNSFIRGDVMPWLLRYINCRSMLFPPFLFNVRSCINQRCFSCLRG